MGKLWPNATRTFREHSFNAEKGIVMPSVRITPGVDCCTFTVAEIRTGTRERASDDGRPPVVGRDSGVVSKVGMLGIVFSIRHTEGLRERRRLHSSDAKPFGNVNLHDARLMRNK